MRADNGLKECLEQCQMLVFDVDGTLTDSIGQIILCFQRTFAHANLPIPEPDAIKKTIGLSLRIGVQQLLPDPNDERLAAEVTQLYRDTYTVSKDIHGTILFAGVVDALQQLKERGYTLAIASGKSQVGMERFFNDVPEMRPLISWVCTGDSSESKPSPAMMHYLAAKAQVPMDKVLGVGDALLDITMFQRAACHQLGVLTGVCDYYDLEDAQTEFILPKVTDLLQYLD